MEDEDDRKPAAKQSFAAMEDKVDCKPPTKTISVAMKDEDDHKPPAKKRRQDKYNKRFSQKKKRK